MYFLEPHSCINCIWHDQCQEETPCDHYDDGDFGNDLPSDETVEQMIEDQRQEFYEEFEEYVKDYN